MNELMEFQSYDQFKAAFDVEARNQAENFIRMGYLLKVARDTNILYESGYKSISEFALQEYGIPGDAVSRMISANDRYSENGYSPKLTDRYSGYGKSLLSEMLTLSDEVVAALPDGITRQENPGYQSRNQRRAEDHRPGSAHGGAHAAGLRK